MAHAFAFVSRVVVSDMSNFTQFDRIQWLSFLQYDNRELAKKTSNDWFNKEYSECSGYTEKVFIDTWQYRKIMIKDIYGLEKDTEFGAIFIEDNTEVVLMNINQNLYWDCREESKTTIVKELRNDKYELQGARAILSYSLWKREKQSTNSVLDALSLEQRLPHNLIPQQSRALDHLNVESSDNTTLPRLTVGCPTITNHCLTNIYGGLSLPKADQLSTNYNQYCNLPVPQLSSLGNFDNPVIQGTYQYYHPTEEELQRWETQDKELWERERTYLHEFDLKSCKFATKMSDLTENEVKLWRTWLEQDYLISDDITDLFDKTKYCDGYNEEIRVMYFQWSHDGKIDTLIDINGWPGDNESGAIFLNDDMIYTNGDQNISTLETTPKELRDRVDAYAHIRIQRCVEELDYDDNHPAHKHCKQINEKYESIYLWCHPSDYRHFMN